MGDLVFGDPNSVIPALRQLPSGQSLVYHTGNLQSECYPPKRNPDLEAIRAEAWRLHMAGLVCLTQRRLGQPINNAQIIDWFMGVGPGFEYIATRKKQEVLP